MRNDINMDIEEMYVDYWILTPILQYVWSCAVVSAQFLLWFVLDSKHFKIIHSWDN